MNESGLQAQLVHKSNMCRLSYELSVGLREIRINLMKAPLTYEELRLKECPRDKNGAYAGVVLDGSTT